MIMNLSELGNVICQDFDQRKLELTTLQKTVQTEIDLVRKELINMRENDRSNQLIASLEILEDVIKIVNNYGSERITMELDLRSKIIAQIDELTTWVSKQREDLQGWYKSGSYLLSK